MQFASSTIVPMNYVTLLVFSLVGGALTQTNVTFLPRFTSEISPLTKLVAAKLSLWDQCDGDYHDLRHLPELKLHSWKKAAKAPGNPTIGNGYELQCQYPAVFCTLYHPEEVTCELKRTSSGGLYQRCTALLKNFLSFSESEIRCQTRSSIETSCVYKGSCIMTYSLVGHVGLLALYFVPGLVIGLTLLAVLFFLRRRRYMAIMRPTSVVHTHLSAKPIFEQTSSPPVSAHSKC